MPKMNVTKLLTLQMVETVKKHEVLGIYCMLLTFVNRHLLMR